MHPLRDRGEVVLELGYADRRGRRLDFKTWFFGHYHDDEWRDGRHRLIYRDIVPVGVRREDEDREPVG